MGKPAAERLGEGGDVGLDAVQLLRAARRDAEAGDDLVEDQQRTVPLGDLAQELEVAGLRRDDAGVRLNRLDQHRRDVGAVLGEELLHVLAVVVLADQQRLGVDGRNTGRCRLRNLGVAFGVLGVYLGMTAPEVRIGEAVVAALHLDDLVAAGVGPRQPGGGHGRLGAGVGEADQIDARHHGYDLLADLVVQIVREGGDAAALGDRFHHRVGDLLGVVSKDQRTVAEAVVDILVAVDVPEPRPLASLEAELEPLLEPGIGAFATGDRLRDAIEHGATLVE